MKSGWWFLLSLVLLPALLLRTAGFAPGAAAQRRPPSSAATPTPTPLPPDQIVVARVYFSGLDMLNHLASELDVLAVQHAQGYLLAQMNSRDYAALVRAGYRVQIDEAKTAAVNLRPLAVASQSGIPGFPCYRTVEETYASMAQLAAKSPNLATWTSIGSSWQKTISSTLGYNLYVLVLGNKLRPGPKPKFFLMAAIHADEYATAEIAARFAEYLVANYGLDPDVTWLLDYYEVHILTQANPDGRKKAEMGLDWRKNVDNSNGCASSTYGVDLNRNSSFKWGQVISNTDPCNTNYLGPSAASEPEVQAIQNYVASVFPDQRGPNDTDPAPATAMGDFITLHSYGGTVLFPWGWSYSPAPNQAALQTLGRRFGFYNGYQVCQASDTACPQGFVATGTTDDWAYGALGLAAYTFEVGTGLFQSCPSFEQSVYPPNLPALLYAFKAARLPYQNPAGPDTIHVTVPLTVAAGTRVTLTGTADDTRYNSGGHGTEPTQNIAAAHYSVDAPGWITGTITYPLSAADGTFDAPTEALQASIDTTGWAPGRHLIFVESQDAAGNWGVPSAAFLDVDLPLRVYLPIILRHP